MRDAVAWILLGLVILVIAACAQLSHYSDDCSSTFRGGAEYPECGSP